MTRYYFAIGQMEQDADGDWSGALILVEKNTSREIARLPFDQAAQILMSALADVEPA